MPLAAIPFRLPEPLALPEALLASLHDAPDWRAAANAGLELFAQLDAYAWAFSVGQEADGRLLAGAWRAKGPRAEAIEALSFALAARPLALEEAGVVGKALMEGSAQLVMGEASPGVDPVAPAAFRRALAGEAPGPLGFVYVLPFGGEGQRGAFVLGRPMPDGPMNHDQPALAAALAVAMGAKLSAAPGAGHKAHPPRFLAVCEAARAKVDEVDAETFVAMQAGGQAPALIDVREDGEWASAHAEGAIHLGKGVIERDIEGAFPDPLTPLVLYCGGGYRSALAAESLKRMGYLNVRSLAGGWRAWQAAGGPVVQGA